MAESTATCFLSSFPHQANQGDPIHALSSSVSFGRYVSESLAWEKWSTFTHNRYKEEAERHSKPGSVAQMKAYFEAYYKKKAADRAAALNAPGTNFKSNSETENQNISVMDQDYVPKDSYAGTGETSEEVVVSEDEIGVSIEVSKYTPCEKGRGAEDDENSLFADPVATSTHKQQDLVEDLQLCKSSPNSEQKGLDDILTVKADEPQYAGCVDVQNPVRDVENLGIDAANLQNKMLVNGAGQLGDPGSLDKDKLAICSTNSRSRTGVPKPPVPPKKSVSLQKSKYNNANQYRKGSAGVPKPPVPPEQSVSLQKRKQNNANLDRTTGVPKPPVPPKQSASLQKRKHNNANLDREGTARVQNPPVPPKLPVSVQKIKHNKANLGREGTAGVTNPSVPPKPPVSLQKRKYNNANLDRKGNSADMPDKKRTTSNASKVSEGNPIRDPFDISRDAEATFQERKVRHRSPLHQPISNSGKEEAKSQSPFIGGWKSPGVCGREARPPIVMRVLIFKSEERAAKRKEFFERLEKKEKVNMSEKEKSQEQTKVKARSDPKPKSETSKTSSNALKTVSTALPCSSTVGRKMPSKLQDNSSQPPRHSTTLPCSASVSTRTPSKLQDNNSRSPWKNSTLVCSTSASTKTPPKLQDNKSRSPWRHSTVACLSNAGTKTLSKLQDNNSRTPWRYSTVACSSNPGTKTPSKLQDNNSRSPWIRSTLACSSKSGTKTPSKLQDNNSRSPWRQSTLACSSSAGRKTPSKLQDNVARSPWKYTTLPCSSDADRKTPSELQDNDSRSPRRHTALASSSSVDKKTPSKVQANNSRPPWRLTAKSKCYKETIEKNNRSPSHPARSRSKKSTHENSSPNIQLSRES